MDLKFSPGHVQSRIAFWLPKYRCLIAALSVLGFFCTGCRRLDNDTGTGAIGGLLKISNWDPSKDGAIELRGEWDVWWDTLIDPRAFDRRADIPGRHIARVPSHWINDRQRKPDESFVKATYHLAVTGIDTTVGVLAVELHQHVMAQRLFVNGKKVFSEGTIGENPREHVPALYHRMECFAAAAETLHIVSHMGTFLRPSAGFGPIRVGHPFDLRRRRKISVGIAFFLLGTILTMGLFHGVVFFLLRRDFAALHLFLFCILFGLCHSSSFFENLWTILIPNASYWVYFRVGWLSGLIGALSLIFLAREQFPKEFPRTALIGLSVSVALLCGLMALPNHMLSTTSSMHILNGGSSVIAVYAIVSLSVALIRKRRGALLFFVGYGALGVSHILDSYAYSFTMPMTQYLTLGTLALVITQTIAIARRSSRMQQQAGQWQQELVHAEKLAAMGTLVSTVAHEVNNPNNVIRLNADTLQRSWKEIVPVLDEYVKEHGDFCAGGMSYCEMREEFLEALVRTSRNSERIEHIVRDLRRFAQKDEHIDNEPVDINQTIRNAVAMLEYTLKSYAGNLKFELYADLPKVLGSARRLEQVVVNLLNNARQALLNRHDEILIATSFDTASNTVLLLIKDNGRGMDKRMLLAAQKSFFSTNQSSGGMGLGLSICKRLVEQHGGRMQIESERGRGTCVSIHLPCGQHEKNSSPKRNACAPA